MKKSILIGAIAALMLFAFVACDNSAGDVAYRIYSYDTPEYVEGAAIDFADWTIYSQNTNGSVTELNAADIVALTEKAPNVDADGDRTIEATYKGLEFELTAHVLNIETLTVDAKNAATKEYFATVTGATGNQTDKDIDLTGVVLKAKTSKGEVELPVADATAKLAAWTAGEQDVSVTYADKTVAEAFKVDVVANRVASISAEATADKTAYWGKSVADYITVTAKYDSGAEVKNFTTSIEYSITGTEDDDYASSQTIPNEGSSLSVNIRYTGEGIVGVQRTASVNLPIKENAAKGIKIDESTIASITLKAGVDNSDASVWTSFDVNFVLDDNTVGAELSYAKEDPQTAELRAKSYKVSPVDLKNTDVYKAGDRYEFTVTTWDNKYSAKFEAVLAPNA